ncbi:hypothetical protein HDU86_005006 [Geranomyces michiganensis]|nr:hypothetical protein HDU86_005006 [Geranomyces michiganensis]
MSELAIAPLLTWGSTKPKRPVEVPGLSPPLAVTVDPPATPSRPPKVACPPKRGSSISPSRPAKVAKSLAAVLSNDDELTECVQTIRTNELTDRVQTAQR